MGKISPCDGLSGADRINCVAAFRSKLPENEQKLFQDPLNEEKIQGILFKFQEELEEGQEKIDDFSWHQKIQDYAIGFSYVCMVVITTFGIFKIARLNRSNERNRLMTQYGRSPLRNFVQHMTQLGSAVAIQLANDVQRVANVRGYKETAHASSTYLYIDE